MQIDQVPKPHTKTHNYTIQAVHMLHTSTADMASLRNITSHCLSLLQHCPPLLQQAADDAIRQCNNWCSTARSLTDVTCPIIISFLNIFLWWNYNDIPETYAKSGRKSPIFPIPCIVRLR